MRPITRSLAIAALLALAGTAFAACEGDKGGETTGGDDKAGEKWSSIPIVAGDGIDSPDFFSLMGAYTGEIYMSTHFAPDDTDPKVQAFVKKYKDLYGKTPGAMAALGYDSAFAIHDALTRAGTSEAKALKDAINGIKDLDGITGRITINAERNADKDVVILKVQPSGSTFFKRIASK